MKKILFVHLLNDFSGSPKVLSQIIESLEKDKIDTVLLTGRSKKGFLTNKATVHNYFFYKRFENKLLTLIAYLVSQVHLFLKVITRKNDYSLIYINTMLPFGAALAGKLTGRKVLYHIHETSIRPTLLKKFLRFIIRITASKIIYVSHSLLEQEGFSEIEENVIYNALPPEFSVLNVGNKEKSTSEIFNVLMICSLRDYKGVREYIKIAKLCQHENKITFTLILNSEVDEIDEYFKSLVVPPGVKIMPKQSDVRPFYYKANLVLNLSRPDEWVETFGLTIIEALSFGIPVIVPPVGGPAEIIREGVEGYLISSYEVNKISDLIIKLVKDPQTYEILSNNASKRAKDFDEKTFKSKILVVLNE